MKGPRQNEYFGEKPKFILAILTVVVTFIASLFAFLDSRINGRSYNLEKYRQTITLCQDFNDWYRYCKSNAELCRIKIWLGDFSNLELTDSVEWMRAKWNGMSDAERFDDLKKNPAMVRLLGYFEDAWMLHSKELLDLDYFDNFFGNLVHNMERTKSPYIMDYISSACNSCCREDIWCGYKYCRDNLITQAITAPCTGHVTMLKIRKGKMIRDTSEAVVYIRDSTDSLYVLRPNWNGRVEKVSIKRGEKVPANKILIKIRGCSP